MELIKWDDSLSVKVTLIDEQHKEFIKILNILYSLPDGKASREDIGRILERLKFYALMHFNTEEYYLQQYGLSIYNAHKKEHDSFIEQVNYMLDKNTKGEILLPSKVTKFMKDWFIGHIKGTDKKYTIIFNSHGLR